MLSRAAAAEANTAQRCDAPAQPFIQRFPQQQTNPGFLIPGRRPFITQPYLAGDPGNDGDLLHRRISGERRHLVTSEFLPIGDGSSALTARFDIIQGCAHGL